MPVDPTYLSLTQLAELIKTGQTSSVELTEHFLDRLDRLGPLLNAAAAITRERAMDRAERADAEIAAGRYLGTLHGLPYGVKDLLAVTGYPTTWGAAPYKDQTFDRDAAVIEKLDQAGAVLAAKLSMVELAGGMGYRQPNASLFGPGINPWDRTKWSGGSSSGSGSAAAAGLVPFALGTETWGSILTPASHCGLTGLRPTYGLVSRRGAMALSWTLDKIGPMARSAVDCGLVLEAVAGPDREDPTCAGRAFKFQPRPDRKFKLAVLQDVARGIDDDVAANFRQSVDALAPVASVEVIEYPDLPYEEITRIILFAEGASAFQDLIDDGRISELTAPECRYSAYARTAILATDYIRALRLRGRVAREFDRLMKPYDALIAPSRAFPASPLDREFRSALSGAAPDVMGAVGNAAGLPAISVPNGLTGDNVPTGMQIMGRAFDEGVILDIALAYQSLTDWHLRRPPEPAVD